MGHAFLPNRLYALLGRSLGSGPFFSLSRQQHFVPPHIHAVDRARHYAADDRFEEAERCAVVRRVKGGLVIFLAKLGAGLKMVMASEMFAHVAVHAEVVEVMSRLEKCRDA